MQPDESYEVTPKQWEPMRLTYVSSVGELMRSALLGSRKDNNSAGSCGLSQRRTGGTGVVC